MHINEVNIYIYILNEVMPLMLTMVPTRVIDNLTKLRAKYEKPLSKLLVRVV